MKKIIYRKAYDTATATQIAFWKNNATDDTWCEETLYQKRTGEYFLHCEGGFNSRWGDYDGESWTRGEEILPLSEKKAGLWKLLHGFDARSASLDGDERFIIESKLYEE